MNCIKLGTINKKGYNNKNYPYFNRYIIILYFINYYYYKKIKDNSKIKNIGNSQFFILKI